MIHSHGPNPYPAVLGISSPWCLGKKKLWSISAITWVTKVAVYTQRITALQQLPDRWRINVSRWNWWNNSNSNNNSNNNSRGGGKPFMSIFDSHQTCAVRPGSNFAYSDCITPQKTQPSLHMQIKLLHGSYYQNTSLTRTNTALLYSFLSRPLLLWLFSYLTVFTHFH